MPLTVVIAVRDGGSLLDLQLDALLGQADGREVEVLVADNGSTDGTPDRVAARAGRDPRLRLLDAAHRRGASGARNVGIAAATHERIAVCDADDVVGDGWLTAMERALEVHPFVGGRLEYDRLNPAWAADARGRSLQDGFLTLAGAPPWPYPFSCNTGVRREAWRAVGGYDETLVGGGEDNDFAWRLRRLGTVPVWVPDAVVHYRCRSDLRGIYRQARAYGEGWARLSERYRDDWPEPPESWRGLQVPAHVASMGLRHVRDRSSLASSVFRTGWHTGVAAGLRRQR